MNVSDMTTSGVSSNSSSVVEMSNQTIRDLRAIAKKRGLRGYCKLRKAELVSLLGVPKKSLSEVALFFKPEDVDFFEQLEMREARPGMGFNDLGELYEFVGEHARVSDAAGVCLHLCGIWGAALFELFLGGGRGVGRSRSADALAEVTALIELISPRDSRASE